MPVTKATISRHPARSVLSTCLHCLATRDITFHQNVGYVVAAQQVMPPYGYICDV